MGLTIKKPPEIIRRLMQILIPYSLLIGEQRIVLHGVVHLGTYLSDYLFVLGIVQHFLDELSNQYHQVFLIEKYQMRT